MGINQSFEAASDEKSFSFLKNEYRQSGYDVVEYYKIPTSKFSEVKEAVAEMNSLEALGYLRGSPFAQLSDFEGCGWSEAARTVYSGVGGNKTIRERHHMKDGLYYNPDNGGSAKISYDEFSDSQGYAHWEADSFGRLSLVNCVDRDLGEDVVQQKYSSLVYEGDSVLPHIPDNVLYGDFSAQKESPKNNLLSSSGAVDPGANSEEGRGEAVNQPSNVYELNRA